MVDLYQKIESTSKRLEKTYLLSEFLKNVSENDINTVILLLQGNIYPNSDDRKTGVATRMMLKAISKSSTGISEAELENQWKKEGDLGLVVEKVIAKGKQSTLFAQELTVNKVLSNAQKLSTLEGAGSSDRKTTLITELLTIASPKGAKYIARLLLEDLRVGIGDGIVRDAIVWTYFGNEIKINYDLKLKVINPENRDEYNSYCEAVQQAYDILNDFSKVAHIAKTKGLEGLKTVELTIGTPLKAMLYQKALDITDAFKRVGTPAMLEYKYDGFRMQVHKINGEVKIFTRRLDEVTKQFPEVVEYVKTFVSAKEVILDAEAVGFDKQTGKYLPFQKISQRIKRKYDIEQMSKDFPIELSIFDILYVDGTNLLNTPLDERRKLLEKIIDQHPKKIICSKMIVTSDLETANLFYQESLGHGEEGIMFKNTKGIYKPGSRVGFGVKVKPVMESLDLVIVGAEWGEGKRSGWFTSFTLACFDNDMGEFLEIGKVGTGIKELEQEGGVTFSQLTEMIKENILSEKGKEITTKPLIVLEINYEEIQESQNYNSGFALRFPRLVRIRNDRAPEECSDITLVEDLYRSQRGRS